LLETVEVWSEKVIYQLLLACGLVCAFLRNTLNTYYVQASAWFQGHFSSEDSHSALEWLSASWGCTHPAPHSYREA
jgi:hypothetical protein